jgi:glycosyltransferase involved in cell wall biosynthesis
MVQTKATTMSKKYLLIGGLPSDDPQSYGGTTVLMQQMVDFFSENGKDFILIKTNRYSSTLAFLKNMFYVFYNLILHVSKVDIVVVNVSRNGAFVMSPIIYMVTKAFRKKFVFRMFGGNFITLYKHSKIKRYIANNTFMRADIVFVETKEILNFVKRYNENTHWFPNTRKQSIKYKIDSNFEKKFVFISSVKQTKGIDEILEASENLDTSYTVDIFGPIQDKKYTADYFNEKKASYKGTLIPSEVLSVLSQYDVLLLPSFHPGEGYPGVIIEAYSLGIPCIATNWRAIPEIVDQNKTGILISPKNSNELLIAIKAFNNNNYSNFSNNALEKFEIFRYESVYENIIKICEGELYAISG